MYCNKCGELIEDDKNYCSNCASQEEQEATVKVDEPESEEPVTEGTEETAAEEVVQTIKRSKITDGFGYALSSVILSVLSYVFAYVARTFIMTDGIINLSTLGSGVISIIIAIVSIIISIGFAVFSIIMAINSIKLFTSAKDNNREKSASAHALGIYGIVAGVFAFIMIALALAVIIASILTRV